MQFFSSNASQYIVWNVSKAVYFICLFSWSRAPCRICRIFSWLQVLSLLFSLTPLISIVWFSEDFFVLALAGFELSTRLRVALNSSLSCCLSLWVGQPLIRSPVDVSFSFSVLFCCCFVSFVLPEFLMAGLAPEPLRSLIKLGTGLLGTSLAFGAAGSLCSSGWYVLCLFSWLVWPVPEQAMFAKTGGQWPGHRACVCVCVSYRMCLW